MIKIDLKNIKRKKIVIVLAVIIFVVFFYYFFKNGKEDGIVFEVKRGDIVRDIFESGTLTKGEEINLGFKTGGKIETIYVRVGEQVKRGDILAKLDNNDLLLRIEKAKRAFQMANTELKKAKKGFTEEEISVYKTSVSNAENNLEGAKISFENARRILVAQIEDAYNKSDDAISMRIDKFFKNPKTRTPQFEVSIIDGNTSYLFPVINELRSEINDKRVKTEEELVRIKEISQKEDPISYVNEVENSLKEIILFLDKVAFAMNSFSTYDLFYESILNQYKNDVSSSRATVSLALSSLLSSKSSFNGANSALILAQGSLESAQRQLDIATKGVREEDIEILKSVVSQTNMEISLIENYIEDSFIRAFRDGIISDIRKKKGEIIQPGESLFSFIGENSFQIEADIYEGEIVKIDMEDKATVELIAFPLQSFKGRVVSIEPSSRVIDGVVYYRIWIDVEDLPERAMPGMTADIIISSIEREGVLVISESAFERRDNKIFIKVINDRGKAEEREIKIGERGEGRLAEVIYGIEEGEKVLIK